MVKKPHPGRKTGIAVFYTYGIYQFLGGAGPLNVVIFRRFVVILHHKKELSEI
jgi:hypothetical protein